MKMNTKANKHIKVEMNGSYKLGMNEVVGLREAMAKALQPIREILRDKAYWDESLDFEDAEYKSRSGFIANKDNCGGLMLCLQVPDCEQYDFSFLEFGECDECAQNTEGKECGANGEYCSSSDEGYLNAYLRIWFKFEGINEAGELEFYINACGGNGDAPYFRVEHLADLFEASFTCRSVAGLQRAASKHIKALLKILNK